MAGTSVLKLEFDIGNYEANVKSAKQAMQDLEKSLHNSGKTFDQVDEKVVEYARAIGNMESTAKSSTQGLRELTRVTTDLTIQYRNLSDEEKNSPFGQALNQSIQQLTERAGKMKDAMVDVEASVKNASSDTRTFDQIAGGATLATSSFQTLQGAAKMLGIEMGDNVEVIAKLQAAMAVTNGLTQIQTQLQKQSAVMQGVMAVQAKAAAAAIELQGKATIGATAAQKAFNLVAKANPYALLLTGITAVVGALSLFSSGTDEATESEDRFTGAVKDTERELDKLKEQSDFGIEIARSAGAGAEALANMRIEAAKARLELAKNARDTAKERIGSASGMEKIAAATAYGEAGTLVQEANAAVVAAIAEYNKVQTKNLAILTSNPDTDKGVQAKINLLKELRSEAKKGSAEYENFTRRINELEKQLPQTTSRRRSGATAKEKRKLTGLIEIQEQKVKDLQQQISHAPSETMITYLRGELKVAQDELDRLNGTLKTTTQELTTGTNIQNNAGLSAYISSIKQDFENADFGSALRDSLQAQLTDMTSLQGLVAESLRAGLGTALFDVADETGADFWARAMEGGVDDIEWQSIVDKINEELKKLKLDPIKLDVKTGNVAKVGKETENSWRSAANAMQSVNSALQQLEDPSAKIIGIIGQAIANIALGFSQASASKANTAAGIWGWIAGIAGGIGTMVSTIAAIHSATGYAEGGIIKGNSYSGDNIPADNFVNAGELVLNKSSQNNLASILTEAERGRGGSSLARVSGEQIWVAVNAYTKRTGKGELVTWR